MRFIFAGGLDRPVIFASSIFLSLLLRTRTRLGDFGQESISVRVVVRVSTEMLGGGSSALGTEAALFAKILKSLNCTVRTVHQYATDDQTSQ